MKLFYLITAALFITAVAGAQVQYNFFCGSQITTASYKVNDSRQTTKLKTGFQAGFGMKVPFDNKLFFAPVAFYSMKGYKVEFDKHVFPPDPEASDNNVKIHTVELGALLQYDLSNNPNHYFISFGPGFDLQMYGKEKFNLISGGAVNKNMRFSFGDYGRFSMSAIGRVGIEKANGLIFFAQYSYGLGNINNADNGPKILHRVFGISVGKTLH